MRTAVLLKFRRAACAFALIAGLAGCDRAFVSGRVLSADGEPLPGVAVSAENQSGVEALSNALGEYRLLPPVGSHALRYSKSGYAPAESRVEVVARETVTLDDVIMWRLPRNKGVYLYEPGRFIETTSSEPRTFLMEGDVTEIAIRAEPGARTDNPRPMILCYYMPRYEARLTRLRVTTAQLKQGQDYTFDVFAGAGTIPVRLTPVDQPEGMLMQVIVDEPLEAGTYALHWGAMAGETVLEPRAYLFAVGPPEADQSVSETATESADAAPADDVPADETPAEVPDVEASEVPDAESIDETEN